jgi:hypothetical protein
MEGVAGPRPRNLAVTARYVAIGPTIPLESNPNSPDRRCSGMNSGNREVLEQA